MRQLAIRTQAGGEPRGRVRCTDGARDAVTGAKTNGLVLAPEVSELDAGDAEEDEDESLTIEQEASHKIGSILSAKSHFLRSRRHLKFMNQMASLRAVGAADGAPAEAAGSDRASVARATCGDTYDGAETDELELTVMREGSAQDRIVAELVDLIRTGSAEARMYAVQSLNGVMRSCSADEEIVLRVGNALVDPCVQLMTTGSSRVILSAVALAWEVAAATAAAAKATAAAETVPVGQQVSQAFWARAATFAGQVASAAGQQLAGRTARVRVGAGLAPLQSCPRHRPSIARQCSLH